MSRPTAVRSPSVREDLPAPADHQLSDRTELAQVTANGLDWSGVIAKAVQLESVRLAKVSMQGSQLARPDLADVIGTSCDLSGSVFEDATLARVELQDCNLVGARWLNAKLTDVRFVRCQMELASFWSGQFSRVRFENCRLREADFHGADLRGVAFDGCDLAQANWADTKLKAADVSTSEIGGLKVGAVSLAGLIVTRAQAVELAKVFGLVVV